MQLAKDEMFENMALPKRCAVEATMAKQLRRQHSIHKLIRFNAAPKASCTAC